jgi:hypothetical protein
MALVPTVQALEGERGSSLFVLLACAGRREKNAFGHHEELSPRGCSVVGAHGGQSSGEGLGPCVPGCERDVLEGAGRRSSDFCECW